MRWKRERANPWEREFTGAFPAANEQISGTNKKPHNLISGLNCHHVVSTGRMPVQAARSAAAQRAYTALWRAGSSSIADHARRMRDRNRTPSGLYNAQHS